MRKILIAVILILACFSLPCYAAVYAEFLPGGEDLPGAGTNVAMTLVSSSVEDGWTDISLTPTIQLDFSKNVVHFSVLGNNKGGIHLLDEAGEPVEILLTFPDDQMQREYKRQIFITPTAPLAPLSEYTLVIDNNLISKNGSLIDNAYFIAFTTGEEAKRQQNRILRDLGDNILTYTEQSGETEFSVIKYTPLVIEEERPARDYSVWRYVLCGLATALMLLLLLMKKRKYSFD